MVVVLVVVLLTVAVLLLVVVLLLLPPQLLPLTRAATLSGCSGAGRGGGERGELSSWRRAEGHAAAAARPGVEERLLGPSARHLAQAADPKISFYYIKTLSVSELLAAADDHAAPDPPR